ncbi:hypothetical protein GCM10010446_68420 [Streptomyces enissocaesilis]|uniref:Uncharacterized protein n=1 Tax=Streptomyces enissocaesilis TaxID=332589 RepID=A0ABN3XP52_9ACTN
MMPACAGAADSASAPSVTLMNTVRLRDDRTRIAAACAAEAVPSTAPAAPAAAAVTSRRLRSPVAD